MATSEAPVAVIARIAASYRQRTDAEVLAALAAIPALADESDPCWGGPEYWAAVAYPYLALADVAAQRRLRAAIPLLLERACFGDPGEIMRGLRHTLEAIVQPEWHVLADLCLSAAGSPRLGTRLWSLDQLIVLDDPRAREHFRAALEGPQALSSVARIGLDRLGA